MRPLSCSYFVTTVCNAKCEFCSIWKGSAQEKPKLLPLEDCERILKGLRRLGVRYIDFTGGEPLIEPNIPGLMKIAKGNWITTGMASNGYLYPSRWKELEGVLDTVAFSLDSADRDRHNATRKLDCYDRVMESIEIARRAHKFVNINFSVGNENIDELEPMAELASKLKVVVHAMPMFSYFGNDGLRQEYVKKVRAAFSKPYMTVNLAALKFVENGGNDPAKPKCRGPKANVTVSPDGCFLLPCFHSAQDRIPIEEDVVAQWKSPEMAALRAKSGRYDFCKGCHIWCYLTTSFLYSPDRYFMLQNYSYAKGIIKVWLAQRRDRGKRAASKP